MNPRMKNSLAYWTDFRATDRLSKAEYAWRKYGPILRGKILDVGADQCHLRQHLDPKECEYLGVGLGDGPHMACNLEKERLPFPDDSFDCVLCLDVLEHLDNLHEVFDQLCRVSRRYVLISLPNPWGSFFRLLRGKDHCEMTPLLHYGLPVEPPQDRHKWFFLHRGSRAIGPLSRRQERNEYRTNRYR